MIRRPDPTLARAEPPASGSSYERVGQPQFVELFIVLDQPDEAETDRFFTSRLVMPGPGWELEHSRPVDPSLAGAENGLPVGANACAKVLVSLIERGHSVECGGASEPFD